MCQKFKRCIKASIQSFNKNVNKQAISDFLKNLRRSKCTKMILDESFLLQSKLRIAQKNKNKFSFEKYLQSYESQCFCICNQK
jgi:hypothetical protein